MCESVLGEFLLEIKVTKAINYAKMMPIVVAYCNSDNHLSKLTAMTWANEFIIADGVRAHFYWCRHAFWHQSKSIFSGAGISLYSRLHDTTSAFGQVTFAHRLTLLPWLSTGTPLEICCGYLGHCAPDPLL